MGSVRGCKTEPLTQTKLGLKRGEKSRKSTRQCNEREKSAKLLKAWFISLTVVGIPTVLYNHYYAYINGLSKAERPLWLEILCVGFPLLYGAMHYDKKEMRRGLVEFRLLVCALLVMLGGSIDFLDSAKRRKPWSFDHGFLAPQRGL